MRDESSGVLEVRVWLKTADEQVLIGERFLKADGRIAVIWHVDPKSISGVVWFEDIGNQDDPSAS